MKRDGRPTVNFLLTVAVFATLGGLCFLAWGERWQAVGSGLGAWVGVHVFYKWVQ